LWFTCFLSLHAQSPTLAELWDNDSKLSCTLTTNKATYFAGEDIQVSLRMWNPTAQPLLVPKILDRDNGTVWFALEKPDGLLRERPMLQSPDLDPSPPSTETLQPNQERVLTTWASEDNDVMEFGAESKPGRYHVIFPRGSCPQPQFTIVDATVEALAQGRTPTDIQPIAGQDEDPPPPPEPGFRQFLAFRSVSTSYLAGLVGKVGNFANEYLYRGPLSGLPALPFRIVTSQPEPVTAINSVSVDPLENITVIWTSAGGAQKTIYLDQNLNPRIP
jgi:hypothetical protein